jgi:hypothetical protein
VRSLATGPDGQRLSKEQVVVGWGDGGSGTGGCISMSPGPPPITGLAAALCEHATVILIHEFGTSKCCSHCGQLALDRPRPGGDKNWARRVQACQSCRTMWHRDVNAARNMLLLLCCLILELPRPPHLARQQQQQQQ